MLSQIFCMACGCIVGLLISGRKGVGVPSVLLASILMQYSLIFEASSQIVSMLGMISACSFTLITTVIANRTKHIDYDKKSNNYHFCILSIVILIGRLATSVLEDYAVYSSLLIKNNLLEISDSAVVISKGVAEKILSEESIIVCVISAVILAGVIVSEEFHVDMSQEEMKER